MAETTDRRVAELSQVLEVLTARFKETEGLFADRLEVSPRELTLIRTLAAEGPMISKDLGSRFGVPVSTMTGVVDRMEKKGLVRRVPHRRDRRSIELEVTPAGALSLTEHKRNLDAMSRTLLEALPTREQGVLLELLQRIRGAVEDAREAG